MRRVLCVAACVFVVNGSGCAMDHDDRCPDGYTYHPETVSCSKNPDDAGGDGGSASGFGKSCTAASDCTAADVDYCVVNPATKAGYCSMEGCVPGGCPGGYGCCDCAALGLPVICVADADIGSFIGTACACE